MLIMYHVSACSFFEFFIIFFVIFLNFFYNLKKKIATCQSDIVSRDKDGIMW